MKITKSELDKILANHQHWLKEDVAGWENMRANLRDVDLSNAALQNANLAYANLQGAVLSHANLQNANLYMANLQRACLEAATLQNANLQGVNLENANLEYAYLEDANLKGGYLNYANLSSASLECVNLHYASLNHADLRDAHLDCANLRMADLTDANLYRAILIDANLSFVNLQNANLEGADLVGVNLRKAEGDLPEYKKGKVVKEPLIGYKKCRDGVIVTLEIPEGAVVFSINGSKCRTNKVKVLAVDGANKGISIFNESVSYHPGDEITDYDFDCQYNVECGSGIHFFTDKEVARLY